MRPPMPAPQARGSASAMSTVQLELTKCAIEASAQITAAMVSVTNEKNPAKISEAYRVIYKTILETLKAPGGAAPGS